MVPIVFNNRPSKLHQRSESIALRACYLLSDFIISAGTSGDNIHFENIMGQMNLRQQLQIIEAHYKNSETPLPETAEQYHKMIQDFRKIKHKNRLQIIALKKLETWVDSAYKFIVDQLKEEAALTGLPELKGLVDGKSIGFTRMSQADLESDKDECTPASKLLKLDFPVKEGEPEPKEEDYSLFCLTAEFFTDLFPAKGTVVSYSDSAANDSTKCGLQKCFTLPNINLLTAIELKSIRKQLEPLSAEFRKQTNAWLKIFEEPDTGNTMEHFQKNVWPHAASLQAAIAQNELIQHTYASQRSVSYIELWMGEIPTAVLWQFYKDFEVIHDATWNILEEALKNEPKWQKRTPVLVINVPLTESTKQIVGESIAEQETEVKSLRKHISVD